MSGMETLGILEEIQALVTDHLQVVSDKWLSRKFLVSSNAAKRLLQEFVEKHEDELEVVYSVAGWLKEPPTTYHVRLVPKPKLSEAKGSFDGNCSVQVYSVQSCIPKDLAAIWNTEFIQTEELFKQPSIIDNCLRDNRFCGVSNVLVKRNTEAATSAMAAVKTKGIGTSGQAIGSSANQTSSVPQYQQKKLPQVSPKLGLQSSDTASAKTETNVSGGHNLHEEKFKDKLPPPSFKKKGQNDKSPAGASLANLWGRASSKSKSMSSPKEEKGAAQNNSVPDSADAQISAIEILEAGSSDDDEPDVNFRRASNGDGGKKRRVILEDSDEDDYENAVINLGSPDPPKHKSFLDIKQKTDTLIMKNDLLTDEREEIKPIVKEEKVSAADFNNPFQEDFSALDQGKKVSTSKEKEISQSVADVSNKNKNKAVDSAPGLPKRRKVLKTRIDERGREVTDVVWEGGEEDTKHRNAGNDGNDNGKNPNGHTVKVEDKAAINPVHRAASTKKSPAVGYTAPVHAAGKAGGKKGANAKDPKQGNIMSFFKKKA